MTRTDYRKRYKIKMKALRLWNRRNRGNRKNQSQRFRDKYIERNRAYQAVFRALKKGILKKPLHCSICKNGKFIMAHHKDYSQWLKVKWVCWKCHNKIHSSKDRKVVMIE